MLWGGVRWARRLAEHRPTEQRSPCASSLDAIPPSQEVVQVLWPQESADLRMCKFLNTEDEVQLQEGRAAATAENAAASHANSIVILAAVAELKQ